MSEPFIAEIRIMPYTFAPRFWTWCEGQILPISSNTAMYSVIGIVFGGDGRSTFAVPNLTQRVPMHWGSGPGLTGRRIGDHGGEAGVMLQQYHMPSHTHRLQGLRPAGAEKTPDHSEPAPDRMLTGLMEAQSSTKENAYVMNPTQFTPMASTALGTYGDSQAHENRQPFLSVNFCIATMGIYPSRT